MYAPNNVRERSSFFHNLVRHVERDRTVILLGDFNCVSAAIDIPGVNVHVDRRANVLEEMADDHELVYVAKLNVISGS